MPLATLFIEADAVLSVDHGQGGHVNETPVASGTFFMGAIFVSLNLHAPIMQVRTIFINFNGTELINEPIYANVY